MIPLIPTGLLANAPPPRTREQAIFDRLVRTLRDRAFVTGATTPPTVAPTAPACPTNTPINALPHAPLACPG